MLLDGISYNCFESTHKTTPVSVTLNTRETNVSNKPDSLPYWTRSSRIYWGLICLLRAWRSLQGFLSRHSLSEDYKTKQMMRHNIPTMALIRPSSILSKLILWVVTMTAVHYSLNKSLALCHYTIQLVFCMVIVVFWVNKLLWILLGIDDHETPIGRKTIRLLITHTSGWPVSHFSDVKDGGSN